MNLKLTQITKSYTNHLKLKEVIFSNLEFESKSGEFTLITGKSGSGKSTMLNLLALLNTPDNGEISISDKKLSKLSEAKRADFRAKNIGFVFQSYALLPEFSILDNCMIPLLLSGVKKVQAKEMAYSILEKLFSDEFQILMNKYPLELSGGQQQRASIARALIHNPSIIIADEPTGNLDDETAMIIKNILKELSATKNIIVVSHDKTYVDIATKHYEFVKSDDASCKSKLVLVS